MKLTRTITAAAIAAAGIAAPIAVAGVGAEGNGAGGVTGPAFYVDGELYRTVGTPTDLSKTRAPAHSFDTIYAIPGQRNVATAAPGDRGYNGGRWRVEVVAIDDRDAALASADTNGSGDIDSDEELALALAAGTAAIVGDGPSFVCPVIHLP